MDYIYKHVLYLISLFNVVYINSFISFNYLINGRGNRIFLLGDYHLEDADAINQDHAYQLCNFFNFAKNKSFDNCRCLYEVNLNLGKSFSEQLKSIKYAKTFETIGLYIEHNSNHPIQFTAVDPRGNFFNAIKNCVEHLITYVQYNKLDLISYNNLMDIKLFDFIAHTHIYELKIKEIISKCKDYFQQQSLVKLFNKFIKRKALFIDRFRGMNSEMLFEIALHNLTIANWSNRLEYLLILRQDMEKIFSIYTDFFFLAEAFKHINSLKKNITVVIAGEDHIENIKKALVTIGFKILITDSIFDKRKFHPINYKRNFLVGLLNTISFCFKINYPREYICTRENLKTYCNYCLQPENPISPFVICYLCQKAFYCNSNCKKLDYQYHQKNCKHKYVFC